MFINRKIIIILINWFTSNEIILVVLFLIRRYFNRVDDLKMRILYSVNVVFPLVYRVVDYHYDRCFGCPLFYTIKFNEPNMISRMHIVRNISETEDKIFKFVPGIIFSQLHIIKYHANI